MTTSLRLQLKGLVLLAVLLGLVALSIAMYQKTFVRAVHVTVDAPRAGLQLNKNGDVRLKGALVGRIESVRQQGDHAVIGLALDPAAARDVPRDARVRILPTTLFGQKYVELVRPAHSAARAVSDGDVLTEDRNVAAIEVGTVLDHLEPVLTALRPHDLATTLEAVANGVEGRGAELGHLISATGSFLRSFDRQLPKLVEDVRLLASVSDTYADLAPDLLAVLGHVTTTSRTVTDERLVLASFLAEVAKASDLGSSFLARYAPTTATLLHDSGPVLALLARYSPEYGCVLDGLLQAEHAAEGPFYDGILHVRMVLGKQVKGYTAQDTPVTGNVGRGPSCADLPKVPIQIPGFTASQDGVGP